LFVLFDGEDTHCGDGLWGTFLTKSPVFSQGDFPKGTHFLNTSFLLVVTLKPNLTIRMGQGKSLEEAGGTVPVQIYSADNVGHGIKGGEMGRIMWQGMDKRVGHMAWKQHTLCADLSRSKTKSNQN
jgi:hypothetical protein